MCIFPMQCKRCVHTRARTLAGVCSIRKLSDGVCCSHADEDVVGVCVISVSELTELFGGVIGATSTRQMELLDEDGKAIMGHDRKQAQVYGCQSTARGLPSLPPSPPPSLLPPTSPPPSLHPSLSVSFACVTAPRSALPMAHADAEPLLIVASLHQVTAG